MECSYSVFMLDDDIKTNDGNTEWEPESEHGDLVCPIASSEFTSLEPIGKIQIRIEKASHDCLVVIKDGSQSKGRWFESRLQFSILKWYKSYLIY